MSAKGTQLTVVERATKALAKVKTEAKLRELAAASTSIVQITNPAGYDQCHASRMALKNVRITIEKTGKDARDDATKYAKAVIAEENRLIGIIKPEEDRLQAIQDAWDAAIEAEKEAKIRAEVERVQALQERLTELRQAAVVCANLGSAAIGEFLADIEAIAVDATFAEFEAEAGETKAASIASLQRLHAAALEREAAARQLEIDRKELARLKAEEAERQRVAAVERARQEAEAKARNDAEAARVRKELENERRIARERQDELDRQSEAQRKALADEAARVTADRAQLEREQEALRRQQEPPPPAPVELPSQSRDERIPDRDEIIEVLAEHYEVSAEIVAYWLANMSWSKAA